MANEFKIKNGAIVSGSITGVTEPAIENSTKMASTAWVRNYVTQNSGAAIRSVQSFTATANQTTFTISGGYTAGLVDVYLNGAYLNSGSYTASNGTTVVLTDAASVDDILDVVIYKSFSGFVTSADQIAEGSTNLYYTDGRSRAALSFVAGSGGYNSTTGVITIPTNNNQITNGAGYITSAALANYVTLDTAQTITGLKTIVRSGDVLNFKIGTDTLYGLKLFYSQNELVPSGEATWSFVSTFNNGTGTGLDTTPLSFFRGVLVTGQRLLSVSVNANLLDYYGNNPSGRYPVYAYHTGVQQFASSIIVGDTSSVVNAATGIIVDLPTGVVANFKGRVIGSNAVNNNEFVTLGQVTALSSASLSLTTTGTSGAATYNSSTGVLNIPQYSGGSANPSAREIQTFTATASQTTFTVAGGYTVGLIDVFINGVRLTSSNYTATNSTTVVLTTGTSAGNIVDIIKYTSGIVNSLSGTGGANYIAKFTGSTSVGVSQIFDNGTTVFIGGTGSLPNVKMQITSGSQRALEITTSTGQGLFVSSGNAFVATFTNGIWYTNFTSSGRLDLAGDLLVNTIANATTDTDRFLVSDNGVIKYRTGAELLSDLGAQGAITNPVTGTGTTNYLPKFTGASTIGNSQIFDNGTNVGIGTTSPSAGLEIETDGSVKTALRVTSNQAFSASPVTAIMFRYRISSGTTIGGAVINTAKDNATENNQAGNLQFWTNNGSTLAERVRISSGGNMGIGATSPSEKLEVQDGYISTYHNANVNDAGYGIQFYTNGGGSKNSLAGIYLSQVGTARTGNLVFATSNAGAPTIKMTMTAGGNVLIGTTTDAGSRLQIEGGNFRFNWANPSSSHYLWINRNSTQDGGILLTKDNTLDWQINNTGSTGNLIFYSYGTSNPVLTLTRATGAATFSSSVTAAGAIVSMTSNPAVDSVVAARWTSGVGMEMRYFPDFAQGFIDNTYQAVSGQVYGDIYFRQNVGGTMTSRMMIQARSGNVGIGTVSPNTTLDVFGNVTIRDADGSMFIGSAGTDACGIIAAAGDELYIGGNNSYRLRFSTSGNVLMDNGGNFLIGTATDTGRLVVSANDSQYVLRSQNASAGNPNQFYIQHNLGNVIIGNDRGTVTYGNPSDYRLKEDFKEYDALDIISKLKTYYFKWKESGVMDYGVIAHEMQEVLPNYVTRYKDAINEDGSIQAQGVDYSKLVPILIKSIQELKAENDVLKGRLDKNNIN